MSHELVGLNQKYQEMLYNVKLQSQTELYINFCILHPAIRKDKNSRG